VLSSLNTRLLSAQSLRARARASGLHFALSAVAAVLAAALVFGLWYPGAYRRLSGGQELFWLIVTVDVVLGPLLTFFVFDTRKPRSELARDLIVIGLMQSAALGYGLFTMFHARPVHLVFEVDRFRVVHAVDVDPAALPKAAPDFRQLPLAGPTLIAARLSRDTAEFMASIAAATEGVEISMQPERWMPFGSEARDAAWERAKPVEPVLRVALKSGADPEGRKALQAALDGLGMSPDKLRLLPVQSRFGTWSALLDESGEPLKLVPFDSF
jgi:hypothetical protein